MTWVKRYILSHLLNYNKESVSLSSSGKLFNNLDPVIEKAELNADVKCTMVVALKVPY